MYAASEKFHQAVYQSNPSERVLIRMPDICLSTEDIINSNLTLTEAVNNEEELTIGLSPASTLQFKILNNHGFLSNYLFTGECEAYIGVKTEEAENILNTQKPYAVFRQGLDHPVSLEGHMESPYLTVNGTATSVQPPFGVCAILIDANTIYCVSETGELWGATWVDGRTWNYMAELTWDEASQTVWDSVQGYLTPVDNLPTVSPFMQYKLKKWAANRRGIWHNGLTSYEFGEKIERFEYVPLGKFIPDQPKKRRVAKIDFNATDKMVLFDKDATTFLSSLTYPITIGEILSKLCEYVGVGLATRSFINSTRTLEKALFDGEEVTCREIVGWIAEAAGSYARMTRDGELELAWFGVESINIPMTQYFNIDVAEYEVKPIDKLQIMGSSADIGVIIGGGENGYQILDNPYMYGQSDTEIRQLGAPIYSRLAARGAFSPINARAVCDWSIQAGDVISITLDGVSYTLPVYRQTIVWNGGGCRVTYESTGSPERPVMKASNRRIFNQNRAMHEIEVSVDGLSSEISRVETDADGKISDLRTTLELTAEGLRTEFTQNITTVEQSLGEDIDTVEGSVTTINNKVSELELTVDGFDLRIESTEEQIGDINDPDTGILAQAKSEITATLESIEFSVEKYETTGEQGEIVDYGSRLTLTANGIEAQSADISFDGLVTFTNLSTPGETVIDGGNITTGTVSANRIDVDNLWVKHLNGADGTFTGTLSAANGTFTGTLSAASGTFSELSSTYGTVVINLSGVNARGVEIGYVQGYNEICILPPNHGTGNIGAGPNSGGGWRAWDQVVAKKLYYTDQCSQLSARKYKTNILPATDAEIGTVDGLEIVTYNRIEEPDGERFLGVIADDAERCVPMLVVRDENGEADSFNYINLSLVNTREIQKIKARLAALEAKLL